MRRLIINNPHTLLLHIEEKMDDLGDATSSPMAKKFPECKELLEAYQRCFKNKKWTWGHVDEDECEEAFEKMRECLDEAGGR